MKINKHIFFAAEKAPELVEYLNRNNIPYKTTFQAIVFDILDTDPHWQAISCIVERRKLTCLSETTFSKKELSEASWLRVRSKWRNGYPQPEGNFDFERITYSDEHLCKACGSGLRQVNPFRFKTAPKWGNRHFMMLNWVEDEFFADDTAKKILIENNISGVTFSCVQNKNGQVVFPEVHQLRIDTLTNPGFIGGLPNIRNVAVCPECGIPKYHPTGIGMHSFHKEALYDMPDVCKTSEIFGWGHSASRLILVRQNVYRTIADNRLDRGLIFEPLNLV